MYTNTNRPSYALWKRIVQVFKGYKITRGMIFGSIMLLALLAFELFNYTTTDFALSDLLGDMRFVGLRWAMILSIAFCGMDFAGIARLFTPEKGRDERLEVWYLLGAWFLAATMNATLTWWGVSIALLNHRSLGNQILTHDQLLAIVPVFVALLVWLIRILMIGTFSIAGERLFSQAETTLRRYESEWARPAATVSRPAPAMAARPAPKTVSRPTYTLGADDDDDEYDQRYTPVRPAPAATMRPAAPPAPVVRPAPKPSVNPAYTSSATTGYRPTVQRASEASGRDRH